MEDQKPWPGLALNEDFADGREFEMLECFKVKMSKLGDMVSNLV